MFPTLLPGGYVGITPSRVTLSSLASTNLSTPPSTTNLTITHILPLAHLLCAGEWAVLVVSLYFGT